MRAWISLTQHRRCMLFVCALATAVIAFADRARAITVSPGPAQPELTETVTQALGPLGERIIAAYKRAPHASRQKENLGGSRIFTVEPTTAFLVEYRAHSAITHARSEYVLDATYKRTTAGINMTPAGLVGIQISVPTKLIAPPIQRHRGFTRDTYSFSCVRSNTIALQLTPVGDHWLCTVGYYVGPATRLLNAAKYYTSAYGTTGPSCKIGAGCLGAPPLSLPFFSAADKQAEKVLHEAEARKPITKQQNLAARFPDSSR